MTNCLAWCADSGLIRQQAAERAGGAIESRTRPLAMSGWPERFPTMVRELRRKEWRCSCSGEEYLREHPVGCQPSCHHSHLGRNSTEVAMHIDHKAREKLFVDYAGDRGSGAANSSRRTFLAARELIYVVTSAISTEPGLDPLQQAGADTGGQPTGDHLPRSGRPDLRSLPPVSPDGGYDDCCGHVNAVSLGPVRMSVPVDGEAGRGVLGCRVADGGPGLADVRGSRGHVDECAARAAVGGRHVPQGGMRRSMPGTPGILQSRVSIMSRRFRSDHEGDLLTP